MSNSPEAIKNFPFPFTSDSYIYSVNIQPVTNEALFDVDEHYQYEIKERDRILAAGKLGRYLALPHMKDAQWDALEIIMNDLATWYPESFTLTQNGDRWTWENKQLNLQDTFTFLDESTLPYEPFEYISRQVQEDIILLDRREGDLFMDAGILTFPASWSLEFDAGMRFEEFHGPVPRAHEMGVFKKAKAFLMRVQIGKPWTRLNWTMTVNRRLDTSLETYADWGKDRSTVTLENCGDKVHLRVEVQRFVRLPRSNCLMFPIHTYLISLNELMSDRVWTKRLYRVLKNLPPDLVDYKGLSRYRDTVLTWLAQRDGQLELSSSGK
jgi:dimethylamine monooxygenase subunit A